jgi:hypothetical protein
MLSPSSGLFLSVLPFSFFRLSFPVTISILGAKDVENERAYSHLFFLSPFFHTLRFPLLLRKKEAKKK